MVGPAAKREAVAHLRNVLGMSERRACTLVAADRKMVRYRARRPSDLALRTRDHLGRDFDLSFGRASRLRFAVCAPASEGALT